MTDHALHERTDAVAGSTATGSTGHTARVVLGPKTRLGRTLIARAADAGHPVHAVARDEHDAVELSGSPATVVAAGEGPLLGDTSASSLRLFVCALGPVHPTEPTPDRDADNLSRDLGLVQQVLDSAPTARVHVVLVSSVIALAPGEDRRYYGGYKCLVEERLREVLAGRADAQLSVLYPGRLMDAAERRRPWHRMHTTYPRLAEIAEQAADGSAASRVVGLDARAWLLARGASLSLRSLSGTSGAPRRREPGPSPVRGREAGRP